MVLSQQFWQHRATLKHKSGALYSVQCNSCGTDSITAPMKLLNVAKTEFKISMSAKFLVNAQPQMAIVTVLHQ